MAEMYRSVHLGSDMSRLQTCFDFISVVGGRGQGIWICKTLDVGLNLGFGNGKRGTRELEI